MASSSESLRVSSLAGCAVTLPKKGLAAEVGLGAWAVAAAPVAAKEHGHGQRGKKHRRARPPEDKIMRSIHCLILSDEPAGWWDSGTGRKRAANASRSWKR